MSEVSSEATRRFSSMLAPALERLSISSDDLDDVPVLDRYDDYADLSRPYSLTSSPCSSRRGSDFQIPRRRSGFSIHTPITPLSTYQELVFPDAPNTTPIVGSPKIAEPAKETSEVRKECQTEPCALELGKLIERARELKEEEEEEKEKMAVATQLSAVDLCNAPEGTSCRFCRDDADGIPPASDVNFLLLPPTPEHTPAPSIRFVGGSSKRRTLKKAGGALKAKVSTLEKAVCRAFVS